MLGTAVGNWGAQDAPCMSGKGEQVLLQAYPGSPTLDNSPTRVLAELQTPVRWPWVHQPSLAQGRYSGFEFLLEVKDLYSNNSEVFADAAHLFLSISPTGALS